jgi:hypothetical protein
MEGKYQNSNICRKKNLKAHNILSLKDYVRIVFKKLIKKDP